MHPVSGHAFGARRSANDGLKAEIERIRDQTQRRLQEERKRFKPEASTWGETFTPLCQI